MGTNSILLLMLQTALILMLSRVVGFIFVYLRQPQVMGEMIAGIMLGPSLFGAVLPHQFGQVFPANSVAYLDTLSQIGVIFFLFLVGLELDPKLIRNRGHAAVVISHASIMAPFLFGSMLALYLYPNLFNHADAMRFSSVALFLGAAMSITAFPVLARILTERNLQRTHVGAIAITCAAVDDVTAWCMLAVVIAVARAAGVGPGLLTAGKAVIYVAIMFFCIRPFLKRLELVFDRQGRLSQNLLAVIILLVLASALTTQWIGIHALFGAFLMGAIMPKGTRFVQTLMQKLEDFTVVFLLPIFFAFTGLRTQIGLLNHASLWGFTGLIILVACLGKFGGSSLAARVCGMKWREACAIGVLMNTRGLMELVILNVGRDLGVITSAIFAMMVLMAVITTALTTPILHWVFPQVELEAEKLAIAGKKPFTILIPISFPGSGAPLAAMASLLSPATDIAKRIVALHLQRPADRDPYAVNLAENQTRLEALDPLMTAAKTKEIPAEPIAFVSRDVPADIARIARLRGADLILMGFRKPVVGQAILGGTVHRVMTSSDSDVAVYVDRGSDEIKSILVPFLGGKHDRLALDIAGRIAQNSGASLTVLHVVPPKRSETDGVLNAKTTVEKTFPDASTSGNVNFKVVEDSSPVAAVLNQAKDFDLVVIGVEEQWGMESHLFGWRPERIARQTKSSLLIVRKFSGPAVKAELTEAIAEAAPS